MLKRHMQYNWWKYLLVILAAIILWCTVFRALAQPKDNEKLNVLFVGEGLDTKKLEQTVTGMLPQLTDQFVRQVKVTQTRLEGREAYEILQMRTYEYDIVIISQSCLQENMGNALFSGAMTEKMQAHFAGVQFHAEPQGERMVPSGIVLDPDSGFCAFYNGQETCYLFASPQSVNFDGLNGLGQAGDDCALRIMEYFVELKDTLEVAQP